LTAKGYLEEIGSDCAEPHQGCSDCAASQACQVPVRHWFLTDKGKSVVTRQS